MKRIITTLLISVLSWWMLHAEITIDECVAKAEANYPVVRKYSLLTATQDIELSDINKSWLPGIGMYAQVTAQNVVPSFPETLTGVLEQMGQQMKGLGKVQYKAGVDVAQTIWDGGVASARRELVRRKHDAQKSALDVEIYAVRQRVENLYFSILLVDEQIAQSRVSHDLLMKNLDKLRSMQLHGTAMQSDVDMVEAQALAVAQQIAQAQSAVSGYRKVLELFIGESIEGEKLVMPTAEMPLGNDSNRPELKLFESQLVANSASRRIDNAALMPKIGLFAGAYYGYPGYDYFKSMMNRDLSFNIMAGVKVSWNIDSFYTKKNRAMRRVADNDNILADRELFVFNQNMQSASQREAINGLRTVIRDDSRIVQLRGNVRKAAESQLDNGVIDTTALLAKISDENVAKLTAKLHEIQLVQEIYKLKYTLNQ